MEIGMDCRVSDPEKRSSIQIHQGNKEMVTITHCCSIKSNDSRLRISCIETEYAILISVNMTSYDYSDLGTWNCSDGKSYDTVTFPDFIGRPHIYRDKFHATFSCMVYENCTLSLIRWRFYMGDRIQRIDGGVIRCIDNYTQNCTFQEIKFSDAGIYYVLHDDFFADAFIVQVRDYPTQPAIKTQTFSSTSDQGLLELICSSESRTQPVLSRRPLSYHWNVNQLNTSNTLTCFRRKGSRLTLCPESCRLKLNSSISVTCTVEEDGLISNKSEPFIIRVVIPLVPVEQLVSTTQVSVSAQYKYNTTQVSVTEAYTDQTCGHSTGALIGICLGCLVAGSVLSVFLTLFFIRRSVLCKKEGEGERNSADRNEAFYIDSAVNSGVRTSATVTTRQYEVLDQNRMENPQSQYAVILSEGSGQTNPAEIYELV
ncbi:hypothetical protein ACJMK2_030407 [Sinanodonta woodiana]|uniref:Ig-like domain-containing protein n=1 Tax=Sinanodonta woodiana TaxID=1069815 RepID=A0ABD3XDJ0_SINWO